MEISMIHPQHPDPWCIRQALGVILAGGIVAYPTDTAYGLAVDATNEEAIGKIFILKRRMQKPLPVLVSGIPMAKKYVEVEKNDLEFFKKYWPGAVTFILKSKKILPTSLTLNLPSIAIRHLDQPVAQALVRELDRPITCTSANISGAGVLFSGVEVARHFEKEPIQPDLILDGGEFPDVLPSTIVDLTAQPPVITRQGKVKVKISPSSW
jgi:L-threonylcarbamoyladenylate synthase